MQARGGDEREQVAGSLGVVVAADEEPGVPANGNAAQLALGGIVGRLEATVVEIAHERRLVPQAVAEGGAEKTALGLDARVLDFSPLEERQKMRTSVLVAQRLALDGRALLP